MQWLIHGHTHRPAVHELIANQQPAFRVVLGARHTEGSMVKVTADDVGFDSFSVLKPATLLISQPRNRFPCSLSVLFSVPSKAESFAPQEF